MQSLPSPAKTKDDPELSRPKASAKSVLADSEAALH